MEVVKKRYDDKTRFEAVGICSSCSAIFHVNEASRHVMILMHQQHRMKQRHDFQRLSQANADLMYVSCVNSFLDWILQRNIVRA